MPGSRQPLLGVVPGSRASLSVDFVVDGRLGLQMIDGFGGAGAFSNGYATAEADLLWTTLGLSIFRSELSTQFTPSISGWPMIDAGGGTHGAGNFIPETQAYARGCRRFLVTAWVFAVDPLNGPWPWNTGGGKNADLLVSHYADAAAALVGYCTNLIAATGNDVQIFVSPANEPDITPSYAQTSWSTAQLVAFAKVLGPALQAFGAANPSWQKASGQSSPALLVGEPAQWAAFSTYSAAFEADSTALGYVGYYGTHQYFGGAVSAPPVPCSKPIWQTECSGQDAYDGSMTNGLVVAGFVHNALTTGNASAWLYWVHVGDPSPTDNGGLDGIDGSGNRVATKRSSVLGQWARHVLPRSQRVTLTGTIPSGVNATGFRRPDGRVALVCVNGNGSATSFAAALVGFAAKILTPWVTDSAHDLSAQSPLSVSLDGKFQTTLAPLSVTTFVGDF